MSLWLEVFFLHYINKLWGKKEWLKVGETSLQCPGTLRQRVQIETQESLHNHLEEVVVFLLWLWLNTWTRWPKRLHPWKYSNPAGESAGQPAEVDPVLSKGVRLDDLPKFLPTQQCCIFRNSYTGVWDTQWVFIWFGVWFCCLWFRLFSPFSSSSDFL